MMSSYILLAITILMAPFYSAIILKVKAFFGGKKGPSLLINYYTLIKLLKKGSVYSESTTFIFKLSPIITLSVSLVVLLFFPIAGFQSIFSFQGDVIFLLYLFGLARFFTILAGLDTASPFEGMGTAREAFFSILAELTLFMILILFFLISHKLSFSAYFIKIESMALWQTIGAPLILVLLALYIITLTENCRVPVDDPATHLELTMIHEVMILDHSGPDLAFLELGAQLKLIFYTSLMACLIFPFQLGNMLANTVAFFLVLVGIYVLIGITESIIARYKMTKTPKFILFSFAMALFATIVILEFPS
jgi:formate hydrogenlyase subunit 4